MNAPLRYTLDVTTTRGMVHVGDCLAWLRSLPDESVDAVVTDPPYGLGKEPDPREVLTAWLAGDEYKPGGSGFMGRAWDAFVPSPCVWQECLRVLKPGGHLLAFAGTRTYDWIVLGVRLAGFEVRDMLSWVYGSGFPKSLDVSKAIDKAAGAEREVVDTIPDRWTNKGSVLNMATDRPQESVKVLGRPATPEAAQWSGWGTALKPAHEPLVWARKPLSAVPHGDTLAECSAIMEALLWSMSPARIVELCSPSSEAERGAGFGSVPWTAAVLPKVSSLGESGLTGMFNSREAAETFSSIATSWNSILDASWALASTSTTRTEIDLITAWRTCASLASMITPESITQAATQAGGIWWNAPNAGPSSNASGWSCKPTQTHIATERATSEVAARVSRELARIAVQLSAQSEGPTRSSAGESATTPAVAPAYESIVMARKPLRGTVASNVLAYGTGGLNVDGCRIETDESLNGGTYSSGAPRDSASAGVTMNRGLLNATGRAFVQPSGRWPANLLHDGSDEVVALFPQAKGAVSNSAPATTVGFTCGGSGKPLTSGYADDGSAARFFYCAKATRREREAGLDHLPRDGARANIHPTVKPLALMRWLVRLVTPPGGLVIDPYTGSGTTGVAAVCEGMRFAGAELDTWHGVLAHERIAYAMGHGPSGFEDVAEGDEDDDTGADVVPMQAALPLGG